jgi:hypothetical protein
MPTSAFASRERPTNGWHTRSDFTISQRLRERGHTFDHYSRGNSPQFQTTKLIVNGLSNLAHRQGENPRKFMARLEKLFNTLHENYASYRVKPDCPAAIQPQGTYTEDNLTSFTNDSVKAYNQFLLTQVFRAAAPESVRKLLSHKDQTRLTVEDVYQTFFTDHRVKTDRKERAMINTVNEEEEATNPDPEVAAFRQQPRQQQQQQYPQQNS